VQGREEERESVCVGIEKITSDIRKGHLIGGRECAGFIMSV
jgi:hypothetical protein